MARPAFEQVDGDQQHEGDDEQHRREGHGPGVIVFLQPNDDEQRRDFRFVGLVAGDENDRTVLADLAGEGQGE